MARPRRSYPRHPLRSALTHTFPILQSTALLAVAIAVFGCASAEVVGPGLERCATTTRAGTSETVVILQTFELRREKERDFRGRIRATNVVCDAAQNAGYSNAYIMENPPAVGALRRVQSVLYLNVSFYANEHLHIPNRDPLVVRGRSLTGDIEMSGVATVQIAYTPRTTIEMLLGSRVKTHQQLGGKLREICEVEAMVTDDHVEVTHIDVSINDLVLKHGILSLQAADPIPPTFVTDMSERIKACLHEARAKN
jgi:hypothetical protein